MKNFLFEIKRKNMQWCCSKYIVSWKKMEISKYIIQNIYFHQNVLLLEVKWGIMQSATQMYCFLKQDGNKQKYYSKNIIFSSEDKEIWNGVAQNILFIEIRWKYVMVLLKFYGFLK